MKIFSQNKVLGVGLGISLALGAGMADASSHREAPFITKSPKVDATDFYMFRSYEPGREAYVTLTANYIPLQDPQGGPNYFSMDPNALYEIHVDNDGDAKEDITFQFRFKNQLANNGEGLTLQIGPDGAKETVAVPLKNISGISNGNTANLNFTETYSVKMVTGNRRRGSKADVTNTSDGSKVFGKPYDYVGNKTFTDTATYAAYAESFIHNVNFPGCGSGKVFVGQRKDSFAVNLGETFDLVNYIPIEGDSAAGAGDAGGFPGGITQNTANDDLAGKNITTIAVEVPISCLTGGSGDVIGGWTSASLRQARILNPRATFKRPSISGGAWTQVSRLSNPLVNELVIGLKDKNRFNSSQPKNDGQFATYVTHPTFPALLDILFNGPVNDTLGLTGTANEIADLAPANFPRGDLVATFLTGFNGVNANGSVAEMIRLNTAIAATAKSAQSTFGVAGGDLAGFPNGRRPGDDVVDIALRVVMGALCHDLPIGAAGAPANLLLCAADADAAKAMAPVGTVAFTDGAPLSDADFTATFPYLATPLAGSPN